MKKWFIFLLAGLLVLNVIQVVHGHNLKQKIKDQELAEGVFQANKTFIEKFFTYDSTKQRYENIKSLMTTKGFNATLPAGDDLPENTDDSLSVSSHITKLQPFQYTSDNNMVEFMNEFKVTTSFNKVESDQMVFVHTVLLYSKEKGWQVDDVEFMGTLGSLGSE